MHQHGDGTTDYQRTLDGEEIQKEEICEKDWGG